jgi:hypothetical protein
MEEEYDDKVMCKPFKEDVDRLYEYAMHFVATPLPILTCCYCLSL